MRFHGGTDVDAVLDAMDYAVYANDVQHIILDNLQFMLTRSGQDGRWNKRATGPWDKFDAQVCRTVMIHTVDLVYCIEGRVAHVRLGE